MKKIFGFLIVFALATITYGQAHVTFTDAGQGYDKHATTAFHFTVDNTIDHQTLTTYHSAIDNCITVEAVDNGQGHDLTLTLVTDIPKNRATIHRYFVYIGVSLIHAEGTDFSVDDFVGTYIAG